jgi:transcriptional regulator with XRE-family HTH domain
MSDSEKHSPYGRVASVEELGLKIRSKRKHLGLTLKYVAGLSGIGIRYLSELERGKKTIELGKALRVMNSLGLDLFVKPKGGIRGGGHHA